MVLPQAPGDERSGRSWFGWARRRSGVTWVGKGRLSGLPGVRRLPWARRRAAAVTAAAADERLRFDRFGLRDLVSEASHGIGARPGRLVLTIIGTVLGIGSLVVTVGLAQTAAGQIARTFDAVAATQVVVEPSTARTQGGERATGTIPWDVEDRLSRIAGVEHVGAIATVNVGDARITAVPVNDPSAPTLATPQVMATTPGMKDAVRGRMVTGRYFDAGQTSVRIASWCSVPGPPSGSGCTGWTGSRRSSSATGRTP